MVTTLAAVGSCRRERRFNELGQCSTYTGFSHGSQSRLVRSRWAKARLPMRSAIRSNQRRAAGGRGQRRRLLEASVSGGSTLSNGCVSRTTAGLVSNLRPVVHDAVTYRSPARRSLSRPSRDSPNTCLT